MNTVVRNKVINNGYDDSFVRHIYKKSEKGTLDSNLTLIKAVSIIKVSTKHQFLHR